MKHCKKIISSILTLTLFAGSVVNLSCFADKPNNDNLSTGQSQQEKSSDFDRCRNYADELDKIKNSVGMGSYLFEFDYAFERLNNLKNALSENDKTVLAELIKSTKSYLIETQRKSYQYILDPYTKNSEKFIKKCNENKELKKKLDQKSAENETLKQKLEFITKELK